MLWGVVARPDGPRGRRGGRGPHTGGRAAAAAAAGVLLLACVAVAGVSFELPRLGPNAAAVEVEQQPRPAPLPVVSLAPAGTWGGDGSPLLRGELLYPGLANRSASLYVLQSLMRAGEVESLVALLAGSHVRFDEDRDTVDDKPTHELYISKDGRAEATATIPGKPDADARVRAARSPLRAAAAAASAPALGRLTAFVNERYAMQCRGQCTACFQFVRRCARGAARAPGMYSLTATECAE